MENTDFLLKLKLNFAKMRQTLHKSLTADRPLHVSIVNQLPENSTRESSQFIAEQKGNDLFYKMNEYQQRYIQSLIVNRSDFYHEEDINKQSIISQTRFQYYKAIEKTLLLENQNLKSHNTFLMKQIRDMFGREKENRKEIQMVKRENKVLKGIAMQLQIRLEQMNEEISRLKNRHSKGFVNIFKGGQRYDIPVTQQPQENSQIEHSIQNIRRILSKTEKQTLITLSRSSYFLENPQKFISPRSSGRKQKQQQCCSPRANKQIGKLNSILSNIQVNMQNLCDVNLQKVDQRLKSPSFRKKKTIQ